MGEGGSESVVVSIVGRQFRVASEPSRAEALRRAAMRLEAQCAALQQHAPRAELERVLLLAALELAADSAAGAPSPQPVTDASQRIDALRQRIECVLRETAV